MRKALAALKALVLAAGLCAGTALAADYPTKPITIIVPWGAGGMSDVTARMLGERLKEILGQPIVYINKGGASGVIGLRAVERAAPDGYTIGSGALTLAISAPYFLDAGKFHADDFSYIGAYMPQERVLFTTPGKPYKTWKEFIAYSKAHPGEVSVGSGGAQWALEVMKSIAKKEGIQWKYVMFKSGGAASSAILGAHVDAVETGTGTPAYQAARKGDLIALADLGTDKVPFLPDVPNMKDLGYRYSTMLEYGMAMPKGVPEDIRAKLENALRTVMQDQELLKVMGKTGFTPRFVDGAGYRKIVEDVVAQTPALLQEVKDVK